jgi:Tfp pilus assembly protein PilZ
VGEKRKFSRLEQKMQVRQKAKDSDNIEAALTQDISAGGLRIATNKALEVGTKLDIEVNIAGASRPYYAIGEVVWKQENPNQENDKFDMGIRFVRIVSKDDLEGF